MAGESAGGPVAAGPLPAWASPLALLPPQLLALADQALVSGTGFLHALAAARCLGVEEFGRFGLAWLAVTCAGSMHQAMLLQPMAVHHPEYRGADGGGYLRVLARWHALLLPPALMLPAALAAWLVPAHSGLILATALATITRLAAEHERRCAFTLGDSVRASLIDTATYGPLAAVAVWFWTHPTSLSAEMAILAAAATSACGWAVGQILLRRARSGPSVPWWAAMRQHLVFGGWLLASALAMQASSQLYPVLLAAIVDLRAVAALALARTALGATHVVMNGLEAIYLPRARRAFLSGGWQAMTKSVNSYALALMLGIGPILAVCAIFPETVVKLCAGEEYAPYGWVLRWLAVAYAAVAANRIFALALQAAKEPRAALAGYTVTALLTLAVGPWAVGAWGMAAVLVAIAGNAVITAVVAGAWLSVLARRARAGAA